MISTWPAPIADGKTGEELLVSFDDGNERRVLVIPALFDEANKMRRFTMQVMRALARADIDSFLPDLPGQNESLRELSKQTLTSWRAAAVAAASHVNATEVLAIRAGTAIAPPDLPGTLYAPIAPHKQLRSMMRARVIAAREAGLEENAEQLGLSAQADGITLAGWPIGAAMFSELEAPVEAQSTAHVVIDQKTIGGRGLWLRAEPDEDAEQAEKLAALIADPQGAPA